MEGLEISPVGATLLAFPTGRLDARASAELEGVLANRLAASAGNLVLNLQAVTYLSSASLRVFLQLHRQATRQGGQFALGGLQPYCREVIRISGLDQAFAIFPTAAEALAAIEPGHDERTLPLGTFRFAPGAEGETFIDVLGHIDDVLHARVTAAKLKSRAFSATEFSLGLGGLGPTDEEVLPLLGEMMTVGGTMVWLPTDGGDTPDFLVPRQDSELVTIRTAFNASLRGEFHEFVHFRAAAPEGATLTELYRALFDLAAERRRDFRGALGLALRGDFGAVYGSGVTRAPIAAFAPADGSSIIDAKNFADWFEVDATPRHREVTGLMTGVGVDRRRDLSGFSEGPFGAAFYRNPGNAGAADVQLHNHGVFFQSLPFPDPPRDFAAEVRTVVEEGTFVDMRHLLDATTVTRAWIGLMHVRDFRFDAEG